MNLNVFKPAQPGLTPQELEARLKREKLVLNSLACVLTNAPMPDDFTIATMQRYVDGELSLDEVHEILLTNTKAKYAGVPSENIA
ncbi:antitoxin VbhA family protein [Adhaeribacter aquaticus]|uniref:antitoxin VbhA family protein n=1 Tax=Adhaeribacter aquaticus TaxID=299567 RepID=UPI000423F4D2|nr:antitoxin VbhA family protein [Adhaeribacter aquaticus]